jgi:hypothetical protein
MTIIVIFEFLFEYCNSPACFLIILKKCNHVVKNVSYDVNIVKTKINILTSSSSRVSPCKI